MIELGLAGLPICPIMALRFIPRRPDQLFSSSVQQPRYEDTVYCILPGFKIVTIALLLVKGTALP